MAGLAGGVIDTVVSDHSPVHRRAQAARHRRLRRGVGRDRLASSSACPPSGPRRVERGHTLADVVRWMATGPARQVGLADRGRIAVGCQADLVVFAPDEEFTVDPARLLHQNPCQRLRGTYARRHRPPDLAARQAHRHRRGAARAAPEERTVDDAPLLRAHGRPAGADRAHHRPRRLHRGVCRAAAGDDARHRHQHLPFWEQTRLWVIARPLSGFAETFSQYIVEVSPGGGSDRPELDPARRGSPLRRRRRREAGHRRRGPRHGPGRLRVPPAGRRLDPAQHRRRRGAVPLDPQGLRAGRGPRRAAGRSSPARPTWRRRDARHGGPLDARSGSSTRSTSATTCTSTSSTSSRAG